MRRLSPTIAAITAEKFVTPLHHPFVTSRGRADEAQGVAVHLTLDDSRTARGESVPVFYVTGETIESVLATVAEVTPALIGLDVTRWRQGFETIALHTPNAPSARCGLEMALLDAWSQVTGLSFWQLCGATQDSIESDLTIPIVPNAGELAAQAWERGLRVFKIKVGEGDAEADHARIRAIREAAPDARLRLDANQAFAPSDALHFVERLLAEDAQIELLEQPVPKEDLAGLAWVAQRCPVPVFADESCCTPQDALFLVTQTPVQGLNLKINKSGIGAVLDMVAIARAAGRGLMLGCMLETRRSIRYSLALAAGTGAFVFHDLDAHLLLHEPGDNPCFHQDGPRMTLANMRYNELS